MLFHHTFEVVIPIFRNIKRYFTAILGTQIFSQIVYMLHLSVRVGKGYV